MDPYLRLKSMEIAAELLCCAQQGSGGNGDFFPPLPPDGGDGEVDPEWEQFLETFFALSDRIANEAHKDT